MICFPTPIAAKALVRVALSEWFVHHPAKNPGRRLSTDKDQTPLSLSFSGIFKYASRQTPMADASPGDAIFVLNSSASAMGCGMK